jgi:hypothetical protein
MKKFSIIILSFIWAMSLIGCGENLSYKEGSSQKAIEGFLKAVQEGAQDKAMNYVLDSKRDAKDLENFVASGVQGYEIISEVYSLKESVNFKKKLEAVGVEMKQDAVKAALKKIQDGLARIYGEKSYLVKVNQGGTEKYFLILYFNSQNLNHITGVIELQGKIMEKVDQTNVPISFRDNLHATVIENL